jgi:HEAT repeat protein
MSNVSQIRDEKIGMNGRPEKQFDADFLSALKYLTSDEVSLAPSLLFALSDVTRPELQEFAKTWQTLSPEKRSRVTAALTELAEERLEADFTRIFRYLLDDEDPQVRVQAIAGLWEDEDPSLIRYLIGALRSDPDAHVRAAAAEGLGRFVLLGETQRISATDGDEILTALLAVIRNLGEDQLVVRRAIESYAYIGDETVRSIITLAYADDDPKMRATAIFAMGRSADPFWKRTVAKELFSQDPQIRFEAARAVGELEFKAAVPRLIELASDPDREVSTAAITSLGQIGGKDARRALIDILEGEDEVAREIAQDALDELEFTGGSSMLLVDVGLESEEEEILADEMEKDDGDEYEPDDTPPDLLDDGDLGSQRRL